MSLIDIFTDSEDYSRRSIRLIWLRRRQEWSSRPLLLSTDTVSHRPRFLFCSVAFCLHLIVYSEIRFYPLSFLDCLFFLMFFSLQVKLSRLCEQDKILQELEATIRTLKEDKVFLLYIHKISFFSNFHVYNICVSLRWCGP